MDAERGQSRRVVLATLNAGKARELHAVLAGCHLDIIAQADFNVAAADETGLSFIENALIKARHAARHTGLGAIADDSGLLVDALNGAPGVHSARYSGAHANDERNNAHLLGALAAVPEGARRARFHCALVYLRTPTDPLPLICEGTWEGRILAAPRGEGGFGYDPLFWDERQQASAAELPLAVKNVISHRGQAVAALVRMLTAGG